MATITTDTYLDGGTARTAGENWTINGATLTIRTDTRWHANAPASMTGSIGAPTVSTSLGGAYKFEGRNVRWMAFDTGTSTVPAIGTSITQGGVTGYLLGVWADYTSAPVAVGGAMPASGFIKFREVTGGTYAVGALTGISASATSADVVGWIEIVHDASTYITLSAIGDGLVATGDWFYLDNCTGSRGQIVQIPTNGGGAGTSVIAVQIETASGSGVFEWFNCVPTSFWSATYETTDARAKFVEYTSNGRFRIGSNGTVDVGYQPPSGCRIRIPNILLRNCTTGARASNVLPSTSNSIRTQFNTSYGGIISLDKVMSDYYTYFQTTSLVSVTNSCVETRLGGSTISKTFTIDNCANGVVSLLSMSCIFLSAPVNNGFTMSNSKFVSANNTPLAITSCNNLTFTNCDFSTVLTRGSTSILLNFSSVNNVTLTNTKLCNGKLVFGGGCSNVSVVDTDYVHRMAGDSVAAVSGQIFDLSSSINLTIDGLTTGRNSTLANTHCSGDYFTIGGGIIGMKIRNIGTLASPLPAGSIAANYPTYIFNHSGWSTNIKIQRVFIENQRSGYSVSTGNSITGPILYEQVKTNYGITFNANGTDATTRGISANVSVQPLSNTLGTHWIDSFYSTTQGRISFYPSEPSATSQSLVSISTSAAQKSGYSGDGYVRLKTVGDYVIYEMPLFVQGHTGFQNVTPVKQGTNLINHSYDYQIDTGSGWNGTWKTLNNTNLFAEALDPVVGFKLKLKITVTTGSTTNGVYNIVILTNSTTTAQNAISYPLDTVTQSFTGLITGSEVRCYTGTDPSTAVEIGGIESTAGSTFSFSHSSAGVSGTIVILAMGYQPIYLPFTYTSVDNSILIQPVVDRNYVNPV